MSAPVSSRVPSVSADAVAAYLAALKPASLILSDVLEECAIDLPSDPDAAYAICAAIRAAAGDGWCGHPCSDPEDFALALAHASGRALAVAQGWRLA